MFRKDLIDLLLGNPMGVSQIARAVKESPSQIADDLQHLLRSLKHTDYQAAIEAAHCRACGFEFSKEKLTKPSKCPNATVRGFWSQKSGLSHDHHAGAHDTNPRTPQSHSMGF